MIVIAAIAPALVDGDVARADEPRAPADPAPPISCAESGWVPTFGPGPVNGGVAAIATFDDGSGHGPALYAGGGLWMQPGIVLIGRWDGQSWTPLGDGVNGVVRAIVAFDDGLDGQSLIVGGDFTMASGVPANRIARWDGVEWSPLGDGFDARVYQLAVFDDGSGSGPTLYAVGEFIASGDTVVNRIARWDGTAWQPLVTDLGVGLGNWAGSLAVFDDGNGEALYVGGAFTSAGGIDASRVVRFDGTTWAPLGDGVDGVVSALGVFDDGSGGGPALYAGGSFTTAGGEPANRIARWDGVEWSPLGAGANGSVLALEPLDLGDGMALYAAGGFTSIDGIDANLVARWDGRSWSEMGAGVSGGPAFALGAFDEDGSGTPVLFVGGNFLTAGDIDARYFARWRNDEWTAVGPGLNDIVFSLATIDGDDGEGPMLHVGGRFTIADGRDARRVARRRSGQWESLGDGLDGEVFAIAGFHDNESDTALVVVGGLFENAGGVWSPGIAAWDGTTWSPLVAGASGHVNALEVFDDGNGPALYAGGSFISVGGISASRIARWDGANWSPLGTGLSGSVRAITVFDDGSGPSLIVGGAFTSAGGVPAGRVARWDGVSWSALGVGMNAAVHALAVYDDGSGSGPALYAGGGFTTADGQPANRIARWDGAAWHPLGDGADNPIYALAAFDHGDGAGPELHVGGNFSNVDGMPAQFIATWNGRSWRALGSGMNTMVRAMVEFDDPTFSRPGLIMGGYFQTSAAHDRYIAHLGCLTPTGLPADLNGDGVVDVRDLAILLDSWGPCDGCTADLNGDGAVGGADLGLLLAAWTG